MNRNELTEPNKQKMNFEKELQKFMMNLKAKKKNQRKLRINILLAYFLFRKFNARQ